MGIRIAALAEHMNMLAEALRREYYDDVTLPQQAALIGAVEDLVSRRRGLLEAFGIRELLSAEGPSPALTGMTVQAPKRRKDSSSWPKPKFAKPAKRAAKKAKKTKKAPAKSKKVVKAKPVKKGKRSAKKALAPTKAKARTLTARKGAAGKKSAASNGGKKRRPRSTPPGPIALASTA